jgi:hypothetical protein
MRGFNPDPHGEQLVAQGIRFLPDGFKAYVNCGDIINIGSQPILVINTRTRHVDRLIYDDFRHLAFTIEIAPRP